MPNIAMFKHKDAQAKAEYVKKLHEQVKAQIEKKNASYARQANNSRKKVVLEPGDWVGGEVLGDTRVCDTFFLGLLLLPLSWHDMCFLIVKGLERLECCGTVTTEEA